MFLFLFFYFFIIIIFIIIIITIIITIIIMIMIIVQTFYTLLSPTMYLYCIWSHTCNNDDWLFMSNHIKFVVGSILLSSPSNE